MSVRKRKTWPGRVFIGRDPTGKQLYHWVGRFPTRRERDDAVAAARIARPWQTGPAPGVITCDEWADRMLARMESGALRTRSGRRYKDSSISTARTQLKAFRAAFGHRAPDSITRTEAEDWAATVAASSVPIVVQLMNGLYRAEEVDRNRFDGLSTRPVIPVDRRPPSEEEMLLLLDGCQALGPYAPIMRAAFTFAAYTLIRPGELMAYDWLDVDLAAGTSGRTTISRRAYRGTIDLPKSNRERTITLVPPARAVLDELLTIPGYPQQGLVFRNKTGGPLTAPTLSAYWRQVCARARVEFDFYVATKHYGVWYMKVRLGLPDAVIAAQAGWSEKSVTKMVATYAHAVDERRLDELDAAFAIKRDADRDAHAL